MLQAPSWGCTLRPDRPVSPRRVLTGYGSGEQMQFAIKRRILHRLARRKYFPNIEVSYAKNLVRLGSKYGGWTFQPSSDLERSTIVSCGLGEDASFDVEFSSRFNARVIMVDPTPRAITHFMEIESRMGKSAECSYVKHGKQPPSAYDLKNVDRHALVLEQSAIWVENTRLVFYAPPNPDHVSHSIVNLQQNDAADAARLEVVAIAFESLLQKYGLTSIPLLKLDIEGAENKVIQHILEGGVLPRQLLVEYDELDYPSQASKDGAERTDASLRDAGYVCRHFDGNANFLYVMD